MSTLTCKKSLMDESEKDVKAAILSYLAHRGIYAWNNHRGRGRMSNGGFVRWGGPPGCADILGIMPDGKFLAIETKRKKGSYGTTEDQDAFLAKVTEKNGVAFVAKSVNDVCVKLGELL